MIRSTSRVGRQPTPWLSFLLSFRKSLRLQYLFIAALCCILFVCLRLNYHLPSNQTHSTRSSVVLDVEYIFFPYDFHLENCSSNATESILYGTRANEPDQNDTRPRPSIARLTSLFSKLISYEEKFRSIFSYLGIFSFTDFPRTLRPFHNDTQRLQDISCLLQRYLNVAATGRLDIAPSLILYLKQVSTYLSQGFTHEHSTWSKASTADLPKPVIILAANSRFFDTLQASMRTVDEHLRNHTVVIYDLGFDTHQLILIQENCPTCRIIPFPFSVIEPLAPHIRNLGNFAWKPIVVQDAVKRFGSIIYGDTSIRYSTSNFSRLLIDNEIRGFSCRELPGHYLPCFTQGGTFTWFNETASAFETTYIAEAGFLAVTDNFLSRLILKTWVTCALDPQCISPINSRTVCKRLGGVTSTHRYDQSAMVTALSFYFFPSPRQAENTNPAPYDMFSSIQQQIAAVRRFEAEPHYFEQRKKLLQAGSSSGTPLKA